MKVDKESMDQEEFMHEFTALKEIHDAGGHNNIAGKHKVEKWEKKNALPVAPSGITGSR